MKRTLQIKDPSGKISTTTFEAKTKRFGKAQIRKIAKEYGFEIEFGGCYGEENYHISYWRIDITERDKYAQGYFDKSKPFLSWEEDDRFENEEHCRKYFKAMENSFLKAYPEFTLETQKK